MAGSISQNARRRMTFNLFLNNDLVSLLAHELTGTHLGAAVLDEDEMQRRALCKRGDFLVLRVALELSNALLALRNLLRSFY